jgi:hypothetical protein
MIKKKLYLNTILQKHACHVTKYVAIFGFLKKFIKKTGQKLGSNSCYSIFNPNF